MKTGYFFGSFNPLHIGHMMVASYVASYTEVDKVIFIVSPQNPFKKESLLIEEHHRLEMVKLAIAQDSRFNWSDIEFTLPKPSYTIQTIRKLLETDNNIEPVIILGSDNLQQLNEWKEINSLLELCEFVVYPRPGFENNGININSKIRILQDVPLAEISSTFIRSCVTAGKPLKYYVPAEVESYIVQYGLFR